MNHLAEPVSRSDALRGGYFYRDARTGRYVSRWYALLWPQFTVKERK